MKKMNGIVLIIGGILFIAIGTGLTMYGQYFISKSDNDKITDQNTKLIDRVSHYQSELEVKEIKIRELEKWGNKISIRLMESLYQSMSSFFEVIQEYSTTRINDVSKESFKILCKGCNLNQQTKMLKSINPYTYYTLREYLSYNWQKINGQLSYINSASTYIPPKAYELFLRIKEKGDPINILSEAKNGNTDLEAWSYTFVEINNLTIELKELMQEIENTNK